jgi:putative tryptophan/tyrosine transport system substrate-binding protein
MKRREFITLFGGAAATWPRGARAQRQPALRRIGVLTSAGLDDIEGQARYAAFVQGLQQLGWIDGQNIRIDPRWGSGNTEEIRRHVAELVALVPDVMLVVGSAAMGPLLDVTRSMPIVFTQVPDPVGAGYVDSMARPGGNITGFTPFEFGIGGKWLELLREVAPNVTRAGIVRDPAISAGLGQWGAIQAVAPSLRLDVSPINLRDAAEIERAVSAFARVPSGGLIVTGSALAQVHRHLITSLAARHALPAVYFQNFFVRHGGLIAYGPDIVDQNRRAAGYVDRILKGEKPAELPVQAPNKYNLAINLKTAKALGLDVPATLLARADEVIE